ncbi:MipA/OmpV family protein [Colwellia sp. MEBiC06753]
MTFRCVFILFYLFSASGYAFTDDDQNQQTHEWLSRSNMQALGISDQLLLTEIPALHYSLDFDLEAGLNDEVLASQYATVISPAQTQLTSGSFDSSKGRQFFLQGSYVVMSYRALDIAVAAKLEVVEQSLTEQQYLLTPATPLMHSLNGEPSTNTTVSVIGSYHLNAKWAIVGSLSTTSLDSEALNNPLIEHDLQHMALIGTTYSF